VTNEITLETHVAYQEREGGGEGAGKRRPHDSHPEMESFSLVDKTGNKRV
jgi:hypothetical protein